MMNDRSRFLLGGFLGSFGLSLLGASGVSKLKIKWEKDDEREFDEELEAHFNPASLSVSSTVGWEAESLAATTDRNAYALKFNPAGTSPPTLSFDLVFDGWEGAPSGGGWGSLLTIPNPTALHVFTAPSGVSVLPQMTQLLHLQAFNEELHRPPLCQVWWGSLLLIEGPLTGLSQEYTRFLSDGTPVRATCSCTFTDASMVEGELYSSDVDKQYTVRLGDTLQAIAGRQYGDPTQWRTIARANGIDDPRALRPGTTLIIPRLR